MRNHICPCVCVRAHSHTQRHTHLAQGTVYWHFQKQPEKRGCSLTFSRSSFCTLRFSFEKFSPHMWRRNVYISEDKDKYENRKSSSQISPRGSRHHTLFVHMPVSNQLLHKTSWKRPSFPLLWLSFP